MGLTAPTISSLPPAPETSFSRAGVADPFLILLRQLIVRSFAASKSCKAARE
jgi:hypothetical protein